MATKNARSSIHQKEKCPKYQPFLFGGTYNRFARFNLLLYELKRIISYLMG